MSEYQHFEFRAIDRPLTRSEMEELRGYSSRAKIMNTGFSVTYHYGDFRGNPRTVMETYFDAFIYVTNWGTRRLIFRFPASAGIAELTEAYVSGDTLTCWQVAGFDLVSIELVDHEPVGWVDEDEDWLTNLVPLREELLRGDMRAFYLAWLSAVQDEYVEDDETGPPVPPGLNSLSEPLRALAEFMELDTDLIAAAAEVSTPLLEVSLGRKAILAWVQKLSPEEKDAALVDAISEENSSAVQALCRRARKELQRASKDGGDAARPTAETLRMRAATLREERERRVAESEAAARKKHLDEIARDQEAWWRRVESLIEKGLARPYDEAVATLCVLRDAAGQCGEVEAFETRLERLRGVYKRKSAFMKRLRAAGMA